MATAAADLESVRRGFQQAGLGAPPGTDGRLEVLVVPDTADLHALLGDPPSSRTRGVTIRGLDRSYTVVPWRGLIASRITLAHEYAHYIDRDGWPPWFREGPGPCTSRAAPRRATEGDPQAGVAAILDGAEWMDWPEILSAARHSAATEEPTFQAQSLAAIPLAGESGVAVWRVSRPKTPRRRFPAWAARRWTRPCGATGRN